MKYSVLSIAMLIALASCQDAPKADEAEATAPQAVETTATGTTYKVNTAQSKMTWIGTKPTGRHEGTVLLKEGSFVVNNGTIESGSFVIDLNTIAPHDQDAEGNTKLQGHLKSADFFDVANHPEGKFEITSVQPITGGTDTIKLKNATHSVTGNLTLKGISKSITFPASVNITDAQVKANADFNINRTEWGLNYQSDKSIRNKFIEHDVNIKLDLVADK